MRNKAIAERDLGDKILDLFYKKGYGQAQIAEELGLERKQVYRYLRDQKLKDYNTEKLEAIAVSENFNPLSVISYYFQSVHHAAKELAFTAIVADLLREKIASILAEGGVEALTDGENQAIMSHWYANTGKMTNMVAGAVKHLEGYLNLFSQVLDVQREVSYVKVITDILRKEDPALYRKIQRALDADPETKRVLEALSSQDVMYYWDAEVGKVQREG